MSKEFYDNHTNFSGRTLTEYYISPGIHCKFNTIMKKLRKMKFNLGLDIGCSGDSILAFMNNISHKVYIDLAHRPLMQFRHFDSNTSINHSVCGSITDIPIIENTFEIIFALDVLEHIENDHVAVSSLINVLKPGGLLVITVPHRMKYYTGQDRICGHFRRYEYSEIKTMIAKHGMKELMVFPVYGQLMKVQTVQEKDPNGTEQALNNLRIKYDTNVKFKALWDVIVKIGAKVMEWDAKLIPFDKTMDICLIFRKPLCNT